MGSTHPSPAVHLQHFLSSVADYENLEVSLPLPRQADGFSPMSDTDRWIVVLHAMVLRKYFVSDERSSERMRLSEVARSLRTCTRSDALTDDWDLIIENIAMLDPSMEYVRDGIVRSEHDVVTDHLYGRYLHGDHEKWQRAGVVDGHDDVPFWLATTFRAARLMSVAELVRTLQRDRLLED